jgi:hypothetical protein
MSSSCISSRTTMTSFTNDEFALDFVQVELVNEIT